MSDFIDQFFGDAKQLKLTATERAQLFANVKVHTKSAPLGDMTLNATEKDEVLSNLLLHMRRNPIEAKQSVLTSVRSYFSFHRMTAGALSVAMLCSIGGGVTYAAEGAMPDDVLYPVKLHVNEPIIEAMQRTPQKRAEWEARVVERRLREAEHVAGNEDLLTEHEERIRQHIEERIEHLSTALEQLPEEFREELSERVDMQLEKHQEFLEKLERGEVVPPPHVREFREGIGQVHSRFRSKFRKLPKDRSDVPQARPDVPRTLPDSRIIPLPLRVDNPTRNIEQLTPDTLQFPSQEGWLSGRKRTTRNRVDEQSSRGFESPSLRQAEEVIEPRKPNSPDPKNDNVRQQNPDVRKDNHRFTVPILRSQHPFFQQGASDIPSR